jgi:hypothetical protein
MHPKRLVWFTHLLSLFACSYVYEVDQDISHGTKVSPFPMHNRALMYLNSSAGVPYGLSLTFAM